MQQAEQSPQQAQPGPGWTYSERLKRWIEPGASPFNGVVPPKHGQFQRGVTDPRQIKGGQLSARTRELLAQDDRILEKIARRWLRDCERGDNRAREQLLDRLEGKVEQSIRAELTSRYVIEEAGTPYVITGTEVSAAASDNIHYVAQCAGDSGVAPMNDEPKSGGLAGDPDAVTPPHREHPPQGGPMPVPATGSVG